MSKLGGFVTRVPTPSVIPCRTVIETIKDVDGDRKCFRMIGGVLVERSVKEVLPALRKNREQVSV